MKFWMRSRVGSGRNSRGGLDEKAAAQQPRQMLCICRLSASSSCFICSSDCIVFEFTATSGFRFAASSAS